jgi:hypothetical protein
MTEEDGYTGNWPKTGFPAHNSSQPRSVHINSSAPLTDKYPPYVADPSCMECGGGGKIYTQVTRYDHDGDGIDIDVEMQPCDCVFGYMRVIADPACKACEGTGEVEEVRIKDNERITTNYSCLCLRYVPATPPDEEGVKDGE